MRADRGLYNLHLTFAEANGAYAAGVYVVVRRVDGVGMFGPFADSGPFFFIALDPGAWAVSATYNGATQVRTVNVGRGATDATFYWPATSPERRDVDP
ncbi:hypothetical protein [Variovorax brevis]|uniref:hypothetical protein n=1 Tax=Variovorax brevis TaxID=3053503 RepID=UPI002574E980|nr:hypothetical protein [Variovorax sp. J22R133]